ncbi:MAG: hypothetical protein AAGA77_25825 [Bacteroidota bacterium]
MNRLNAYILVFAILAFMSCDQESRNEAKPNMEDAILVNVTHSAGDKWASTDNFLPLPFNIAKLGSDDVIILSERLDAGKKIDVKPIGAIRILENDTLLTYVISLPSEETERTMDAEDFDEFATVFSGAKWIIEQYMLNRGNSNTVRLKSWENENFANKYLLK